MDECKYCKSAEAEIRQLKLLVANLNAKLSGKKKTEVKPNLDITYISPQALADLFFEFVDRRQIAISLSSIWNVSGIRKILHIDVNKQHSKHIKIPVPSNITFDGLHQALDITLNKEMLNYELIDEVIIAADYLEIKLECYGYTFIEGFFERPIKKYKFSKDMLLSQKKFIHVAMARYVITGQKDDGWKQVCKEFMARLCADIGDQMGWLNLASLYKSPGYFIRECVSLLDEAKGFEAILEVHKLTDYRAIFKRHNVLIKDFKWLGYRTDEMCLLYNEVISTPDSPPIKQEYLVHIEKNSYTTSEKKHRVIDTPYGIPRNMISVSIMRGRMLDGRAVILTKTNAVGKEDDQHKCRTKRERFIKAIDYGPLNQGGSGIVWEINFA